jgi:hypothetical protein
MAGDGGWLRRSIDEERLKLDEMGVGRLSSSMPSMPGLGSNDPQIGNTGSDFNPSSPGWLGPSPSMSALQLLI